MQQGSILTCCTKKLCFFRSGISWNHHLDIGAGVIDRDYTGNVGVILFNHSEIDFKVAAGDRVAQLILEKIEIAEVVEVEELEETERGIGGFGSTGIGTFEKAQTNC